MPKFMVRRDRDDWPNIHNRAFRCTPTYSYVHWLPSREILSCRHNRPTAPRLLTISTLPRIPILQKLSTFLKNADSLVLLDTVLQKIQFFLRYCLALNCDNFCWMLSCREFNFLLDAVLHKNYFVGCCMSCTELIFFCLFCWTLSCTELFFCRILSCIKLPFCRMLYCTNSAQI